MKEITSYSPPSATQKIIECLIDEDLNDKTLLDVGAGEGYFLQALSDTLQTNRISSMQDRLSACDLNPHLFKYQGIECKKADLNQPLPYPDNTFDYVISIEVIEHLENQFSFVRELSRILKPGGKVFVTTPNILNINSRLKNFFSGFALLYGPLSIQHRDEIHTTGHIHPIGLYYLYYIFAQSDLGKIKVYADRLKKSSQALSLFFYPWFVLRWALYKRKIKKKNINVYKENQAILNEINTWKLLCSRTLILSGQKKERE